MPHEPFSPPLLLSNGWVQTLGALLWPSQAPIHPAFGHSQEIMPLDDGDALVLSLYDHKAPSPGRALGRVILVHGLCGDQDSNYMRRSAMALMQGGYELCLVNLRGSGPGSALASQPYHAGRSEDIRAVVAWLQQRYPDQKLDLIGYSLGANIVLKYLGEAGANDDHSIQRALAISPPIDLGQSCERLMASPLGMADRYFSRLLVEHVERMHQARSDLGPPPKWPKKMTVRDFDELYTAPRAGYQSATHYYQSASSKDLLEQIKIPTKMIWAKDDALIAQDALANATLSPAVTRLATSKGGHIGYLDPTLSGPARFWLLHQLPAFLEELSANT